MLTLTNHKALDTYYARLSEFEKMGVTHEGATSRAFENLLDELSSTVGWKLVPQQKLINKKVPDATLYEGGNIRVPRGYWEAKDTSDDLDKEIKKKKKIYPLTNIIFEDTRRAVLYQNGQEAARFDLTQREQLQRLLEKFFGHTSEQIEQFKRAVAQFGKDIPELSEDLQSLIKKERAESPVFIAAFTDFYQLCRKSINPAIRQEAVEEMLIQHLITKRLFAAVFNLPQFTQHNVIGAEIEKVITALTVRSWNEAEFLGKLDYFYHALAEYAATLTHWELKQSLLNDLYEFFFQRYAKRTTDTHGIVYTPQPIVSWMWRAINEVLHNEFKQSLSTPGLKILDPCTGTGNFLVHLLRVEERDGKPFTYINSRDLPLKYKEDLFCNEIMLLPYYVACLNIEHAYFERQKHNEPFNGICFADTLDLAEPRQPELFVKKNTERVTRQKLAPITVIIGNPPYYVGQKNEMDNNKNRPHHEVDKRVRETYMKASRATNKNALGDPYVKFFRWATDRLQGRDGIVCFVSNNSFIDQNAFDGMRKWLRDEFHTIYHIDLHGNVRKNPKLSGTTHNVFGIQVGVGITLLVRNSKRKERQIRYHRVPETWLKTEKLEFLEAHSGLADIEWQDLQPDKKNTWLTEGLQADFDDLVPIGTQEAKDSWGMSAGVKSIFRNYGRGVATCRDEWAYDWDRNALKEKIQKFIEFYNSEVHRWEKEGKPKNLNVDNFVNNDFEKIKWSRDLKLDLKRGRLAKFDE